MGPVTAARDASAFVASALGAICMAFHRIIQKNLPVALVGTGIPQLPRRLREAKPYAERLFQY